MNFCPKIKAILIVLVVSCFAATAFGYSEAQRATDFYKHQQHKKQQERIRLAATREQRRINKERERLQEKNRKQFI